MDRISPNKLPVPPSSEAGASNLSTAVAEKAFEGRRVVVATQQQSASFLPTGEIQQHSSIAKLPQKALASREFTIVKDASQSQHRDLVVPKHGALVYDYPYTEIKPKPQSQQRDLVASKHGVLVYDYPYTEIKPKPRTTGGEYSKLQHERGQSDTAAPPPAIKPQDPWLPGADQSFRRHRYATLQLQRDIPTASIHQAAGETDSPNLQSQLTAHSDTETQVDSPPHDVDTDKARMPTPPPPERPIKSSAVPQRTPTPPPIPERTYRSSSQSQAPSPTVPPRLSKPSVPPPLYSRSDKPSVAPPVPPRSPRESSAAQSHNVGIASQATTTSRPDTRSKSENDDEIIIRTV